MAETLILVWSHKLWEWADVIQSTAASSSWHSILIAIRCSVPNGVAQGDGCMNGPTSSANRVKKNEPNWNQILSANKSDQQIIFNFLTHFPIWTSLSLSRSLSLSLSLSLSVSPHILNPTSPPNLCECSICDAVSGQVMPGHTVSKQGRREKKKKAGKEGYGERNRRLETEDAKDGTGSFDSGGENGGHAREDAGLQKTQ